MGALTAVLLGLPLTLLITVVSFVIGFILAIPLVVALRSEWAPVRLFFRFLVDLIRGIPIIVWLFIIYFGIVIGHFKFKPIQAAIVGFSLISAAYLAEILRGGIQSVHFGQWEAAEALGLKRSTAFLNIVAPQAYRITSPSIATYLIGLLKDSSIASTIGVTEMVYYSTNFARQNPGPDALTPFFIAALVYIVVSVPLAVLARRLDARLRKAA
ncbi:MULTISPECIES: amino acid ABC transporter permease [unclassified Pseudoclavibacter]|uniref:amino acid ABC transporter permease n=1 Tax=unclassified Pseudoclavibacter TaxID=2615177 RepID=UPI001301182F|nr:MULTISPECIES: amino acid ABC transporter permease [unclassified Pseudoclavibacter]KAB1659190.1 amino acid ABC transporter permease [Pseudoclavibacter sp. CFCC 11306]KAB1660813.1 amino acid ABC transporter permease [Pseudoclavibacter sp. CFCC 13796]